MHCCATGRWVRLTAVASVSCAFYASSVPAIAAGPVRDYRWFLRQLTDLDGLIYSRTDTTCRQFSSYDRRSHQPGWNNWIANGDAGQYIRVEPDGEAVMAEMDGPGCIFRIWSANPQGRIRFYLDGDEKPTYEWDFNLMFQGGVPPFFAPLVWKRGARQSSSDAYFPIPYARKCKVTADKAHRQYYHIGYVTYPKDTAIQTFRLPLTAAETATLRDVMDKWRHCGNDPQPKYFGIRRIRKQVRLEPGDRALILDADGPGIVRSIRARIDDGERYAYRKVLIEAFWDREHDPSVLCPLDGFFGTGWYPNLYRSLPTGFTKHSGYNFFRMPFARHARIGVIHKGLKPLTLSYELIWEPLKTLPDDALYFHARWRREAPCDTFDYPFLKAEGAGHLVGVQLNVDYPVPHWWGEGDEKAWVDGEAFPSTYGTGSEDYFGDAWGIRYLSQPSFGCSLREGTRTVCYRWHIADYIPFTKSLKFTIENYPDTPEDYSSTAFWYQREPHKRYFKYLSLDDLRPWGRSLAYTVEAEEVFFKPVRRHGEFVEDVDMAQEMSHGRGIDCGVRPAGDDLLTGVFGAPRHDIYYFNAVGVPGLKTAPLEILVDGRRVPGGPLVLDGGKIAEFGGMSLAAGKHSISVRPVRRGRLALDCVQTAESPKPRNVIEAEGLKPVGSSGQPCEVQEAVLRWGHGRQLLFKASKPGDFVVLDIPAPRDGRWVLAAGITQGPNYGDFRAYQDDREVGGPVSGYGPVLKVGPRVALGPVVAKGGRARVRLQVTGKDSRSKGHLVGLDLFEFRRIIVEGAIEGETAKVVAAKGAQPTVQALGPQWSGGKQLWLTNKDPDGFVAIETSVPKDGRYRLDVYFTTSWDYAIVQVYLDDKKVGDPVDTFTRQVIWKGKTALGPVDLKAGKHVIRFQSVGKNPKSGGYYMGIDCVTFVPM